MNYDFNKDKVEPYNVFNNIYVQQWTEREVKKYLRSPKNYKYRRFAIRPDEDKYIYGFEGLCEAIRHNIACEEHFRSEYEMGVCYKFETDINKVRHMDCYLQCEPNIESITHECIRQYKEYLKAQKNQKE